MAILSNWQISTGILTSYLFQNTACLLMKRIISGEKTFFPQCIQGQARLNVDRIKMRQCVPILMVTLDSLAKWVFFNNFGKSFILSLHYTSCHFSKVTDFQARWIGLGYSWNLRGYPVLLMFETHLKVEVPTDTGYFMEYWIATEKRLMEYACYAPVKFILPGNRPLWRNGNW